MRLSDKICLQFAMVLPYNYVMIFMDNDYQSFRKEVN